MILIGMVGKIGAIFSTIPTPVLGGMFLIMFGVITAAGISNLQVIYYSAKLCPLLLFRNVLTRLILQSTDMNSSRNIFIFGFSMFSALVVPHWIQQNPDFLETGIISLLFNSLSLF